MDADASTSGARFAQSAGANSSVANTSSPKTLVWRGRASKTLDPKAKPDKQEKNLRRAVAKMLKNYPPQPKK